jgi:hypothetical protein
LSGVLGREGFVVTAAGGKVVSVGAGIALKVATAPTIYDSDVEWLELTASSNVDLTSLQDGANPRWVVIEIAANDGVQLSEARDVFDNTLGTFTPVTVEKIRGSAPTITATAGTAAASPVMPGGAAGRIPLAYVYLPASPGSVASTDITLCRPILSEPSPKFVATGGGVDVPAVATNIQLRQFQAYLQDSAALMSIDGNPVIDLAASGNPNIDSGVTLPPASDGIFYVYAAAPPYPTGYDADLAQREMVPKGFRIPSANLSIENAIVFVTDSAPSVGNAKGVMLASTVTLYDGTWGTAIVQANTVYLGSIRVRTTGNAALQTMAGGGEVAAPFDGLTMPSESDTQTGTSSTGNTGNFRKLNCLSNTGTQFLPNTAVVFIVTVKAEANVNADITVTIEDETGGGLESYRRSISSHGATNLYEDWTHQRFFTSDGTFTWGNANTANGCDLGIDVVGYVDDILARRH